MRKSLLLSCAALLVAGCLLAAPAASASEPKMGGVLTIATPGEPPTLDNGVSLLEVVGLIAKHYYETPYSFGQGMAIRPLLAERMPDVTPDGLEYVIPLRKGVKFHNGKEMTSEDMVVSAKRWLLASPGGKLVADYVDSVEALDAYTVKMTLNTPFSPIVAYMANITGGMNIYPAEQIKDDLTMDIREYIGTGPYKFVEHQPDRFIHLVRFDEYVASPDPADLIAGNRVAYVDELRFVPVPNANTRLEGVLAGQFQYADQVNIEDIARLQASPIAAPVLTQEYGKEDSGPRSYTRMLNMHLNCKEGLLSDVRLRRAVQAALSHEDMLLVAFGEPEFYGLNGAMYPEGYVYYSDRGLELYNQNDVEKAKALLKEANYDGTPLRILTSMQYAFHFKLAQVAAENLREAGFTVELVVVDWATLTQQRNDPSFWEIFITHSTFMPEPFLNNIFNDSYPGWWVNPLKTELSKKMNAEPDVAKRVKIFADIQQLMYDDAAIIRIGDFNNMGALAKNVKGFVPSLWLTFFNVWLE